MSAEPSQTSAMTPQQASREPFLELVRELARTYQAFTSLDARMLREQGLTPAQADVIFTLGNTEGMTLGELGGRTLITKGTLTGVVDRLEDRGLVRREPATHDRRCTLATLTGDGEALFEQVFPRHIAALKERFKALDDADRVRAIDSLRAVRAAVEP